MIDTNTIIDFLGNKLSSTVIDWLEQIIDNQEHCLSVINKIELLSFNGDPAEMAITKAFIADTTLLPITDSIIDTTIDIRKTKKVKLPDALIAATVKIHNLTIITRNISDFKDFIGIDSIINPIYSNIAGFDLPIRYAFALHWCYTPCSEAEEMLKYRTDSFQPFYCMVYNTNARR